MTTFPDYTADQIETALASAREADDVRAVEALQRVLDERGAL